MPAVRRMLPSVPFLIGWLPCSAESHTSPGSLHPERSPRLVAPMSGEIRSSRESTSRFLSAVSPVGDRISHCLTGLTALSRSTARAIALASIWSDLPGSCSPRREAPIRILKTHLEYVRYRLDLLRQAGVVPFATHLRACSRLGFRAARYAA